MGSSRAKSPRHSQSGPRRSGVSEALQVPCELSRSAGLTYHLPVVGGVVGPQAGIAESLPIIEARGSIRQGLHVRAGWPRHGDGPGPDRCAADISRLGRRGRHRDRGAEAAHSPHRGGIVVVPLEINPVPRRGASISRGAAACGQGAGCGWPGQRRMYLTAGTCPLSEVYLATPFVLGRLRLATHHGAPFPRNGKSGVIIWSTHPRPRRGIERVRSVR